ncbi:hypothetical protein [Phycicoccus sp.]|uniref:hypothetical protein n=1 Tax=Phycicoccus sp. TaxID=1902410 RepID=UPI002D007D0A|nr:hypothetical protein [Phycicoccus sp.]HMM96703.1 hypothetical protein [Phycicoccus sp.]
MADETKRFERLPFLSRRALVRLGAAAAQLPASDAAAVSRWLDDALADDADTPVEAREVLRGLADVVKMAASDNLLRGEGRRAL